MFTFLKFAEKKRRESCHPLILTFLNGGRRETHVAHERFSGWIHTDVRPRVDCRSLNLVRSWHSPRALWILKSWHMEARSERKEHRLTLLLASRSCPPFGYCAFGTGRPCWNSLQPSQITNRWSRRTHFVTFDDTSSFHLRSSLGKYFAHAWRTS